MLFAGSVGMSGHGCPVLEELEMREDYGDEMNPPVLSGGDYDISAIRDCAENCKAASLAWSRGDHLRSIALILGLAPGDTAEIDNTVRELIRSRDEWLERAAANAARIEELTQEAEECRKEAARMNLALSRIVNGEATAAGMQAIARNALDGKP
jgi:hypothetical protein